MVGRQEGASRAAQFISRQIGRWLFVIVVCVVGGFSSKAIAHDSAISGLGNEAIPLTEAMARFLTGHKCITPGQLEQF